jgi:DNA-binding transcriptional MerR regulator
VTERSHLAIGEVLSLLRDEFPDVTISKIRFLESQGLVDPERTPSGYRKFYENDVERLRWILLQQKEHFLPLKVIKDRLEEIGEPGADHGSPDGGSAEAPAAEVAPPPAAAPVPPATPAPITSPAGASAPVPEPAGAVTPEPAPSDTTAEILAAHTGGSPVDVSPDEGPAEDTGPAPAVAARPDTGPDTLTLEELAEAAGMEAGGIEELQGFGLLSPAGAVGGTAYFDLAALEVARTAAAFARHGVEARHLRAWRNGAEREAGMFEQIVMPLLRQRNPQARQQAEDTLAELAGLGGDLRAALVRQALRSIR